MRQSWKLWFLILVSLLFSACSHDQDPLEATQEQPVSCAHEWLEATCEQPAICTLCKETDGEAMGHTSGARQMTDLDPIALTAQYTTSCQVCDKVLESDLTTVTSLHEESRFLLTPDTFRERIWKIIYDNGFTVDQVDEEPGVPSECLLRFSDEQSDLEIVSVCEFYHDGVRLTDEDANKTFSEIRVKLGINRSLSEMFFANTSMLHVMPVMMTCDPLMSYLDAQSTFNEWFKTGTASANGIQYQLLIDEEENVLILVVQLAEKDGM